MRKKAAIASILIAATTAAAIAQEQDVAGSYACLMEVGAELRHDAQTKEWVPHGAKDIKSLYHVDVKPTQGNKEYLITVRHPQDPLTTNPCVNRDTYAEVIRYDQRKGFLCSVGSEEIRFNPKTETIETYYPGAYTKYENEETLAVNKRLGILGKLSSRLEMGKCVRLKG